MSSFAIRTIFGMISIVWVEKRWKVISVVIMRTGGGGKRRGRRSRRKTETFREDAPRRRY